MSIIEGEFHKVQRKNVKKQVEKGDKQSYIKSNDKISKLMTTRQIKDVSPQEKIKEIINCLDLHFTPEGMEITEDVRSDHVWRKLVPCKNCFGSTLGKNSDGKYPCVCKLNTTWCAYGDDCKHMTDTDLKCAHIHYICTFNEEISDKSCAEHPHGYVLIQFITELLKRLPTGYTDEYVEEARNRINPYLPTIVVEDGGTKENEEIKKDGDKIKTDEPIIKLSASTMSWADMMEEDEADKAEKTDKTTTEKAAEEKKKTTLPPNKIWASYRENNIVMSASEQTSTRSDVDNSVIEKIKALKDTNAKQAQEITKLHQEIVKQKKLIAQQAELISQQKATKADQQIHAEIAKLKQENLQLKKNLQFINDVVSA